MEFFYQTLESTTGRVDVTYFLELQLRAKDAGFSFVFFFLIPLYIPNNIRLRDMVLVANSWIGTRYWSWFMFRIFG